MAFDGTEGEVVALKEAASWTAAYRSANPKGIKAFFCGMDHINDILDQDGCVGIRMYKGIHPEEGPCLILVGCDSEGHDLTEGIIVERLPKCPPICDEGSPLNG